MDPLDAIDPARVRFAAAFAPRRAARDAPHTTARVRRRARRPLSTPRIEHKTHNVMAPKMPAYARQHTPFSMKLEDPTDFCLKLAGATLLWEIPRFAVSRAIKRWYGKTNTPAERDFVRTAPSYVMSTVHALAMATTGLWVGNATLGLPNAADRYYLHAKSAFRGKALITTEISNWLFCGYMTGDLAHVLAAYPRLGKVDMVVHHACFIAASLLAGGSQTMMLPFSWLLIGEYSTPILCLRWFIQQMTYELKSARVVRWAEALGYRGDTVSSVTNAGKRLEFNTSVVFMAVFFVVRIVCYTGGLVNALSEAKIGTLDAVPRPVKLTLLALVTCGAALNYYWFSIMIRKAMRGPPKPKKEETDAKEE